MKTNDEFSRQCPKLPYFAIGATFPTHDEYLFKLKTSAVSDDEVCTHICLIANSEGVKEIILGLREAIPREKCSFFNIVQKAFDPPPFI